MLQHKKLKPGLVASCDIWPANREGLFWFRRFTNLSLTFLLRYFHLLTALGPTQGRMDTFAALATSTSPTAVHVTAKDAFGAE